MQGLTEHEQSEDGRLSCHAALGVLYVEDVGARSVLRQAVLRSRRVDGWKLRLPMRRTLSLLDRLQSEAKRNRERAERNYPRIPRQPGCRDCVDAEEG
jgi:hypothetical protein